MHIQKLDVFRVRNIQALSIFPSPAINIIYGNNGSGKSSLLEAIYILGRAGSFRSNNMRHVINQDADELIISALITDQNEFITNLGVQFTGKECEIRINQKSNCKRSELVYSLPIQLIFPKSYELLDGASKMRREFIDWGVFNQNETFLSIWRKYKKSLMQRNALLKTKSFQQIKVWDNELIHYAEQVSTLRSIYVQQLELIFREMCQLFLDFDNVGFKFLKGWEEDAKLDYVLNENIEKDFRYGFTQFGPHRADFQLVINNKSAKDYVSRGQLKLLVLALKIAQVQLLQQKSSKIACILIDDLTAELDSFNRAKLLRFLAKSNFQSFITANELNELNEFGDLQSFNDIKMFHVEHGKIQQM